MDPWTAHRPSQPFGDQSNTNSNSSTITANETRDNEDNRPILNNNNSEFEDHFVDITPAAVLITSTSNSTPTTTTKTAETTPLTVDQSTGNEGSSSKNFEKLPDSQVYLDSLEKKLKAIQSGKKKTSGGTNSSSGTSNSSGNYSDKPEARLIQSLGQTRESYMVNLLADTDSRQDSSASEEIHVNPILKKLVPEKQAISTEELVELLKADQLNQVLEQQHHLEETDSEVKNEILDDKKHQGTDEGKKDKPA